MVARGDGREARLRRRAVTIVAGRDDWLDARVVARAREEDLSPARRQRRAPRVVRERPHRRHGEGRAAPEEGAASLSKRSSLPNRRAAAVTPRRRCEVRFVVTASSRARATRADGRLARGRRVRRGSAYERVARARERAVRDAVRRRAPAAVRPERRQVARVDEEHRRFRPMWEVERPQSRAVGGRIDPCAIAELDLRERKKGRKSTTK